MASEQDTGLNLLGLAPEIVDHIVKYAPKDDLPNVRLASRELDRHAVRELFREVFLSPSEEHIEDYTSISQHEFLRQLPRHAVIHSQPSIEEDSAREYEEPGEDFEAALTALARFPNIDSLEIAFTPECLGLRENAWYEDVAETVSVRKGMLELIFQAVKDRAADADNRTIRKLTIINLQNCPIPDFTQSDLFRDVMSQLEELHLQIVQEYNEPGPDHDYTRVELQTFPDYLVSDWLRPVSENLKALSIYSRSDNWGPFPGYFRPAGLCFPKLETLAMGYYTLAHDDDLGWVLGIKSLKKLVLHSCMVLSRARFDPHNMDEWKPRTDEWHDIPEEERDGGDWPDYAYHGKWSEFFGRIADGLPNLVDFRFYHNDGYCKPEYGLKNRDHCGVRLFPQRYVVFDNGILPTHWPEAKQDGRIYCWTKSPFPNFHEERREEDQRSLDRLLEVCRRRATGRAQDRIGEDRRG
ncbi:hypothetical protein VM1G_06491 [Cytospora mali]|uniref:F-box domain-containing protein n=1 Tax=Cytospora mali TaxID=578113 RepID=A0A194W2N7_CYTMA|nr:hypothetical protein VM1G_06491 [Valsa mali]